MILEGKWSLMLDQERLKYYPMDLCKYWRNLMMFGCYCPEACRDVHCRSARASIKLSPEWTFTSCNNLSFISRKVLSLKVRLCIEEACLEIKPEESRSAKSFGHIKKKSEEWKKMSQKSGEFQQKQAFSGEYIVNWNFDDILKDDC